MFETAPFERDDGLLVVWPSQARADAFAPLGEWRHVLKEGTVLAPPLTDK